MVVAVQGFLTSDPEDRVCQRLSSQVILGVELPSQHPVIAGGTLTEQGFSLAFL